MKIFEIRNNRKFENLQENAIGFNNLIKHNYFPNRKLHFRLHIHIFLHAK